MAETRRSALDPMVAGMMTEGMPELMQKLVLDTRTQTPNQRPQPKMQTSLGQFALDTMQGSTGFERGLSRIAGALTKGRVKPFQTAPQQVATRISEAGGLMTPEGGFNEAAVNILAQGGAGISQDQQSNALAIRLKLAQQRAIEKRTDAVIAQAKKLGLNSVAENLEKGGDLDSAIEQVETEEARRVVNEQGRTGKIAYAKRFNLNETDLKRIEEGKLDEMDFDDFKDYIEGQTGEVKFFNHLQQQKIQILNLKVIMLLAVKLEIQKMAYINILLN